MLVRRDDGLGALATGYVEFDAELDPHLLTYANGGWARSCVLPDGFEIDTDHLGTDTADPWLRLPDQDEVAEHGPMVAVDVARRRRRRAWRRCADHFLRPRGVSVKEAIDIADMLDDGRIVLVEVPETHGAAVHPDHRHLRARRGPDPGAPPAGPATRPPGALQHLRRRG